MNTDDLHVFLADDDEDDRLFFSDAIEELNTPIKVSTFDNGVDLMAALLDPKIKFPDLIFLDLNMPLMNGEECLADIRNEQKTAKIPVVIYSTHFDLFKVKFLKDKGADRYLQKPKSFSVLKTCLERCIESFYGDPKKVNPDDEFIIQQKRH